MTRQELIAKLEAHEAKNINYTTAQVVSAIANATQAEKDALAGAVNLKDKALMADIIFILYENKRKVDAQTLVNNKIINDKIDIDDVAAVLNGY